MLKNWFLIFAVSLAVIACSQSDAQREFEDEAQSPPENITEMGGDGRPVENGTTDPDDWRASPMYRNLVEIETPAFPNPVTSGTPVRIEIDNKGIETINGIEIYAFEIDFSNLTGPIYTLDQSNIYQGIIPIQLNSSQISLSNTDKTGLFRILIYDDRRNLISYGDVRVQQN